MAEDLIANALGMIPMLNVTPSNPIEITQVQENIVRAPVVLEQAVEDDFVVAREAMRNTLELSQNALTDLIAVATQSQHPRAYEVVATMIKTINDNAAQLLDLSKTKKGMTDGPAQPASHVHNTVVIRTSTADMLKRVRAAQRGENIIENE
jgi:hypothetical protein